MSSCCVKFSCMKKQYCYIEDAQKYARSLGKEISRSTLHWKINNDPAWKAGVVPEKDLKGRNKQYRIPTELVLEYIPKWIAKRNKSKKK